MVGRRSVLTAVGVALGLSGCAATQDEFEFSSEPGSFADSAVEESGYEELDRQEVVEERTVSAGGEERDVTVTNYAQPYQRRIQLGGEERVLAAAAVFTTPSISFVGQQYNPIADESPQDLAQRARGRIERQVDGSVSDLSKVSERQLTVLDTDTTVSVFEAVVERDGAELTLTVYITKVKHQGDFVLVAGGFPKQLAEDEQPRLQRLFENVEHDGDE